jgi:hypothetical protein
MNRILHRADARGVTDHGWLYSRHTVSFANYYNPERVGFGKLRVSIGGPGWQQPYSAWLLNVSALSFGALSSNAVRALNREEWNRARPDCWSLEPETGQYGGDALREERTETGG